MKVEIKDNQIILKKVYNPITLETIEGKQLHICMRDNGFEMKINNGDWYLISNKSDFSDNAKESDGVSNTFPTQVKKMFAKLTDDERMYVISDYCRYCGIYDTNCQCWNDD